MLYHKFSWQFEKKTLFLRYCLVLLFTRTFFTSGNYVFARVMPGQKTNFQCQADNFFWRNTHMFDFAWKASTGRNILKNCFHSHLFSFCSSLNFFILMLFEGNFLCHRLFLFKRTDEEFLRLWEHFVQVDSKPIHLVINGNLSSSKHFRTSFVLESSLYFLWKKCILAWLG